MLIRIALPVLFVLAACTAPQSDLQPETTPTKMPSPASSPVMDDHGFDATLQASCAEDGGSYQRAGMLGQYRCILPFSDAGKSCSDASDCEGKCLAIDGSTAGEASARGQCAPDNNPFGCYAEVRNGVVGATRCVD